MLRFGVILLVASAFAAPKGNLFDVVDVGFVTYDEVGLAPNTGLANHLTDAVFSLRDEGDINLYMVTLNTIVNDIASRTCRVAQGFALGQAIAMASAQATGIPGDACQCAEFIDAYVSGNYGNQLNSFVNYIAQNLDRLANQKMNPQSARYAVGPRSGCQGGGRTYQFEKAWDAIIANASPESASYVNEEYCTAKRLYCGFDVRSNIEAAALTAYSLPPIVNIMNQIQGPLSNFAAALASNSNISSALQEVKQSLYQCL